MIWNGGLVLFGLYLGQRLGDLAKSTWRAVDLDTGEIAFSARKARPAHCAPAGAAGR